MELYVRVAGSNVFCRGHYMIRKRTPRFHLRLGNCNVSSLILLLQALSQVFDRFPFLAEDLARRLIR